MFLNSYAVSTDWYFMLHRSDLSKNFANDFPLFQPPIVILNISVLQACGLEAKDADGKSIYLYLLMGFLNHLIRMNVDLIVVMATKLLPFGKRKGL